MFLVRTCFRGQIKLGSIGLDWTDSAGTWYLHLCYLTAVLRRVYAWGGAYLKQLAYHQSGNSPRLP
jgi:hypothetical protein